MNVNASNLSLHWQHRVCVNELRAKHRQFLKQQEKKVIRSDSLGAFADILTNASPIEARLVPSQMTNVHGVVSRHFICGESIAF